jgi:hypothetical protein
VSKHCGGIWYSATIGLYPRLHITWLQTLEIGRRNDESEEWYEAVSINDDCPENVSYEYFADKFSTKMVEEAAAAVSRNFWIVLSRDTF